MTHLYDVHNIKRRSSEVGGDFGLYLKEHFPVPKCCCGCGKEVNLHTREFAYARFAKDCINKNRFRNPSCIEFYLDQDMSVDDAIIALSERQSSTAKRYSTDNLKRLLSERSRGARNPMSYKSLEAKADKPKELLKQHLSEKSSGSKNGFYGRCHTDETKRVLAKTRSLQSKIVTKPELVFWAWLHALGLEFEFEFHIDKYCVDFCVSDNIVFEVYGDYWHSDRFVSNNGKKNKKERDAERKRDIESLGYIVYVFWESEIMKTPKEAFAKLKEIVQKLVKYENQINKEN